MGDRSKMPVTMPDTVTSFALYVDEMLALCVREVKFPVRHRISFLWGETLSQLSQY